MMLGFGLSLDEKVEKAIANLREYEKEALKRDPVNGYYLCDSYGKDSGVILSLALRAGVRFVAHHNLTTLDPPELIYHGRKMHPFTIIHRPIMPMLRYFAAARGDAYTPPTRKYRWCCSIYKEGGGRGLVRVCGIRAEESHRRKMMWKVWTPRRDDDGFVLNPILYWTEENVWQYTLTNNIPYCCLYGNRKAAHHCAEDFDRLGCVGCPQADREKQFKRWPRFERAWKAAFCEFYKNMLSNPRRDGQERWVARFQSADELWRWWMEGMPKEEEENDCQMGLF